MLKNVCTHFSFFLSRLFLSSGKPAEDEVKLGSLKLKPNTKIMMMGTREESLVGGREVTVTSLLIR